MEERLEWCVNPARKHPHKTFLLFPILIFVFVLIYWLFKDSLYMFLAVVFLSASVLPFFVTTTYVFTLEEIQVKRVFLNRAFKWSRFRSFYPDKNGILLSPYRGRSRLETIRGLYLMLADNKETVMEFVRSKIEIEDSKKIDLSDK